MSTLVVSNINDGTTTVPATYMTNGSAKAWVNLNGTGTIAARETLNVSSITDNGTGFYYINFASAFVNNNFVGSGSFPWSNNGNQIIVNFNTGSQGLLLTLESNAYVDNSKVMGAFHGDLA